MTTPRALGAVAAWLAAVAAALVVALAAIGAVGSGITDQGPRPLSEAEIAASLATTTTPVTTATTTMTAPSTAPAPAPAPRAIASPGGTVLARCLPAVDIVSTTPAQGYRVESIEPEDGAIRVRFRAASRGHGNDRVEVFVRCDTATPAAVIEVE